jgi:protein arginine kinase
MTLDELIRRPGTWLASGESSGIIVSSRIRLARNIDGVAFPGWAGEDECSRLQALLQAALQRVGALKPCLVVDMADLSMVDREFLRERHLISNELAQKSKGSGLVMREDEVLSVMINEEDHLRLQAMRPGLQLAALWREIDTLDSQLEQEVRFAFSHTLGYLTACPTNVGTGLRASVMVHIPGLRLLNEVEPIIKGLTKIGLAVRGLLGEGTEASGNMFQISNQTTLGESETVIIERLEQIVTEIANHETHARARLMEQRENQVRDHVGRAYGILGHARVLSSREMLDLLSGLRLGCELGIMTGLEMGAINRLMISTQPGHLQKLEERAINPDDRDEVRARLVRETIGRASLVEKQLGSDGK